MEKEGFFPFLGGVNSLNIYPGLGKYGYIYCIFYYNLYWILTPN